MLDYKVLNLMVSAELTGRKVAVQYDSYGQEMNVPAGGTVTVTITPPIGVLWRNLIVFLNQPIPLGATSGTHDWEVLTGGLTTSNRFLYWSWPYNVTANITGNVPSLPVMPTVIPDLSNLIVTNSHALSFKYYNNSNATQTYSLLFAVTKEVEYIV